MAYMKLSVNLVVNIVVSSYLQTIDTDDVKIKLFNLFFNKLPLFYS